MKNLFRVGALILGFAASASAIGGGPAGAPILNSTTYQPQSSLNIDSGTIHSVFQLPYGPTPPAADCNVSTHTGRVFISSTALSGRKVYVCEGLGGWIVQGSSISAAITATTSWVKKDGVIVDSLVSSYNVTGNGFAVTSSPAGQVNISLATVPVINGGTGSGIPPVSGQILVANSTSSYVRTTPTGNSAIIVSTGSGSLGFSADVTSVTLQGNTFNTAGKLVQLNGSNKLPAVDGSLLTGIIIPASPGASYYAQIDPTSTQTGAINVTSATVKGKITISSGTVPTGDPHLAILNTAAYNSGTPPPGRISFYNNNSTGSLVESIRSESTISNAGGSIFRVSSYKPDVNDVTTLFMASNYLAGGSVPRFSLPGVGSLYQWEPDNYTPNYFILAGSTVSDSLGLTLEGNSSNDNVINLGNTVSNYGATTTGLNKLNFRNTTSSGTLIWDGPHSYFIFNNNVRLSTQTIMEFSDSTNGHFVGFKASATVANNNTYVLPASSGTAGQSMLIDGNNNLYFGAPVVLSPGLSTLAVSSNNVVISSPTSNLNFRSPMIVTLQGTTSAQVTMDFSSVTAQGNFFNGNSQLVKTTLTGTLPSFDANSLTNLNAANLSGLVPNSSIDGSSITKQGRLVAGSNITLTPSAGALTIASSGSGGSMSPGASYYVQVNPISPQVGVVSIASVSVNGQLNNEGEVYLGGVGHGVSGFGEYPISIISGGGALYGYGGDAFFFDGLGNITVKADVNGAGGSAVITTDKFRLDSSLALQLQNLNCTGNTNGGKLKTDASGNVVCGDDIGGGGSVDNSIVRGRLTTETGVAISTTGRTAQGTIYFTPYQGNTVALYNGTAWFSSTFTERSLSLTATSGKNYDVYISSSLVLSLGAAWTTDTARSASSIVLLDGVYVNSSTNTLRYLGTIRASGTNITEDSESKRFVWNKYNQRDRKLRRNDPNSSWSYNSATWRVANASATNQVEIVSGENGTSLDLTAQVVVNTPGGNSGALIGIGKDWTSGAGNEDTQSIIFQPNGISLIGWISAHIWDEGTLGYHSYVWIESADSATETFYGGTASGHTGNGLSGLLGTIKG